MNVRSCGRRVLAAIAVLLGAASFGPLAAAQTIYKDPRGLFQVAVPAGWVAQPDDQAPQVILSRGTLSLTIFASQQNRTNALTAEGALKSTAGEFQGQCKTYRQVRTGEARLAGWAGKEAMFTCEDRGLPTVAESFATLTPSNLIVGVTSIAPLGRYQAALPEFDDIRDSLKLAGDQRPPEETASRDVDELKRACAAGTMTQEDCARRLGILLGRDDPAAAGSGTPEAAGRYTDPQRRFSLAVPAGWTATTKEKNGEVGVQLRSGSSWINIKVATAAASARDVVLAQERGMVGPGSGRTLPLGPIGIVQIFGQGHEIDFDHVSASSPDGKPVVAYVSCIADVSGVGGERLLLVGSFADDADYSVALGVAQSVKLPSPGHAILPG